MARFWLILAKSGYLLWVVHGVQLLGAWVRPDNDHCYLGVPGMLQLYTNSSSTRQQRYRGNGNTLQGCTDSNPPLQCLTHVGSQQCRGVEQCWQLLLANISADENLRAITSCGMRLPMPTNAGV